MEPPPSTIPFHSRKPSGLHIPVSSTIWQTNSAHSTTLVCHLFQVCFPFSHYVAGVDAADLISVLTTAWQTTSTHSVGICNVCSRSAFLSVIILLELTLGHTSWRINLLASFSNISFYRTTDTHKWFFDGVLVHEVFDGCLLFPQLISLLYWLVYSAVMGDANLSFDHSPLLYRFFLWSLFLRRMHHVCWTSFELHTHMQMALGDFFIVRLYKLGFRYAGGAPMIWFFRLFSQRPCCILPSTFSCLISFYQFRRYAGGATALP